MSYKAILKKHGLSESEVSTRVGLAIKRYNKLEAAITQSKEQLKTASEKKRAAIESEILRGEEALSAMDAEIADRIEKFVKHKELNQERVKKMAEGRERKKQQSAPTPVEEVPPVEPPSTTPVQQTPAAPEEQTPAEENEVPAEEASNEGKKKGGFLMAALAGLALVGGAALLIFKVRKSES